MKNYFVWLLLLLPLLATGCYGEEEKEDGPGDYIWDFINYNIYFSVKDAAGACWTRRFHQIYWLMKLRWNTKVRPFRWKTLWIRGLICPGL